VNCLNETFLTFLCGDFDASVSCRWKGSRVVTNLFVVRIRRISPFAQRCSKALVFSALISLVCDGTATARGGGGHGMGRFGFHHGGIMGLHDRTAAPAFVLITASSVSDRDAFKKAIQDMTSAVASFSGRLAVDAERPSAWEGAAPEHVVVILFADAEQAQAWKNSDAFKSFDAELQKSSASAMQLAQGLPTPVGRGRSGRGGFDAKAFEPNVQEYDRLLDRQLKTICRGC
jgi:uncharacterized protein (DUF1330 family)